MELMQLIDYYTDLVVSNFSTPEPSEKQLSETIEAYEKIKTMVREIEKKLFVSGSIEEAYRIVKRHEERVEATKHLQKCKHCNGWGCEHCCSSEEEIRRRQGSFS